MSKLFVRRILACAAGLAAPVGIGCGGMPAPPSWLENGGIATTQTPEFFWVEQIRKIAAPFKPAAVAPAASSTNADLSDADYSQGAAAFHQGKEHYAEACAHWQALLNRPPAQRHNRSVWAAFMLGKVALYQRKPEAVEWFQKARQLAKEGFSDELHLAEDSYGWEAKSELEQGHFEKAAPLYLTQLALGDDSAVVSLKSLSGDNFPFAGTPPILPEGTLQETRDKIAQEKKARDRANLERAARDPLLRRITTSHMLAVCGGQMFQYDSSADSPCKDWLEAIEKANLTQADDADQLGWIAYTAGKYAEAERWLKLCSNETTLMLWLKAKLLRRNGKSDEATRVMAQVVKQIRTESPPPQQQTEVNSPVENPFIPYDENELPSPLYSASGDLGVLHLAHGDFIAAYAAFQSGGLGEDAAFVADHILTANELKTYVDEHAPWTAEDEAKAQERSDAGDNGLRNPKQSLRDSLARHLVRDHRYSEARPYFDPSTRKVLDKLIAALAKGSNEELAKSARADALFDAACIVRDSGTTLMSAYEERYKLEANYDWPQDNIARQRETKTQYRSESSTTGRKDITATEPLHMHVSVTSAERKRLIQHKLAPNRGYHYLYTAADFGWKAAQLLPNESDQLAKVLNTCGLWIQDDEPAADKFFQAIERRASTTALGKAAGLKHWFIHDSDQ